MNYVIVAGGLWGPTLYGPFSDKLEAELWANGNDITDLDNVTWEIVELESPLSELELSKLQEKYGHCNEDYITCSCKSPHKNETEDETLDAD